jgi:hypothetical protein
MQFGIADIYSVKFLTTRLSQNAKYLNSCFFTIIYSVKLNSRIYMHRFFFFPFIINVYKCLQISPSA